MFRLLLLAAAAFLTLTACQPEPSLADQLDQQLEDKLAQADPGGKNAFRMPKSNDFAAIPQDPRNPITAAKVTLGRLLFHETGLAIDPLQPEGEGTYSCASCHFAEGGFQANRFQGIGEGGSGFGLRGEGRQPSGFYAVGDLDVQPVRTPSAMNGAYQEVTLWNGQFGATGPNAGTEEQWKEGTPVADNHLGYQGLETQAIAGLNVHRLRIDLSFLREHDYDELFDAAFPELPAFRRYNRETAGLAIAAYERTLLANRSPFQRWLGGDRFAMTKEEKRGAILFFGEAGCVSCHSGPALNSMSFHALGMDDLDQCPEQIFQAGPASAANLGRGSFTGREEDKFRFKTPQLYNLTDSPFLGHGSSFRSVEEVVRYKNEAIAQNERVPADRLSDEFRPLNLTEQEITDLVWFLELSLYDPELERYTPPALPSGFCFPNNDMRTRTDRGCE